MQIHTDTRTRTRVCVYNWETRHVLSISACVQTTFPSCNQNRWLWGLSCECVKMCVYLLLRVCMHPHTSLFHQLCVYALACSCNSLPTFVLLQSVSPSPCLFKCIQMHSLCVHACVCVPGTFTDTVHGVSQTWKDTEKKHTSIEASSVLSVTICWFPNQTLWFNEFPVQRAELDACLLLWLHTASCDAFSYIWQTLYINFSWEMAQPCDAVGRPFSRHTQEYSSMHLAGTLIELFLEVRRLLCYLRASQRG